MCTNGVAACCSGCVCLCGESERILRHVDYDSAKYALITSYYSTTVPCSIGYCVKLYIDIYT